MTAMAKQCRTIEHTADIGLEAKGLTLAEMLEAQAEGLVEFICPRGQVKASQSRTIEVSAEDVGALAVDFLSAVLGVLEGERFAISSVKVEQVDETSVRARIEGEPLDLTRHRLEHEVKAVTYHQLSVRQTTAGWEAVVFLDI